MKVTGKVEREAFDGKRKCCYAPLLKEKCHEPATEKVTITVTTSEPILLLEGGYGYGYTEFDYYCKRDADAMEVIWSRSSGE